MKKEKDTLDHHARIYWGSIAVCVLALIGLLYYQFVFIAGEQRALDAKFPEIEQVSSVIKDRYPDKDISIQINQTTGNESKSLSTFMVTASSPNLLGEKEIRDIGQTTCGILTKMKKTYDKVIVVSHKPFLPIPLPFLQFGESVPYPGSCGK